MHTYYVNFLYTYSSTIILLMIILHAGNLLVKKQAIQHNSNIKICFKI